MPPHRSPLFFGSGHPSAAEQGRQLHRLSHEPLSEFRHRPYSKYRPQHSTLAAADRSFPRGPDGGRLPEFSLVPFYPRPEGDPEADRDLGVAMIDAAVLKGGPFREYLPRAFRLLERAKERDPADVNLLALESQGLLLAKQKKEALEVCRELLRVAPDHEQAALHAALVCMDLQQFDDALAFWDKAISLNRGNADSYLFRAMLLARQGKFAKALADCRQASELDPLDGTSWYVSVTATRSWGPTERAWKI